MKELMYQNRIINPHSARLKYFKEEFMKLLKLLVACFLFLMTTLEISYSRDCHGRHGGGYHYNNQYYNSYPSYSWRGGHHQRGYRRWHHKRQPIIQNHYYGQNPYYGQPTRVVNNNYPVYIQPEPQSYYIGNQGRIGVFFESGF